jgi:Bacterial Ig-like domain (group 1)
VLYQFAGTAAFHDAASMGSDFEHVGLGSPNLDELYLLLNGRRVGAVSASGSQAAFFVDRAADGSVPAGVMADGTRQGTVVVDLVDAQGNFVSGKSVTLTANRGSAVIIPSSAVTSAANGTAVFHVSDVNTEDVTFTATDTSDDIQITQQPTVSFLVLPAASAVISGGPATVTANGASIATITVTLTDALSRPTPGKLVTLAQVGGDSVISGPTPSVTDNNGQITFTTTDLSNESISYTATDVSDGNFPVPGSVNVDFSGSPGGCSSGSPPAAPGYAVNAFATGFTSDLFTHSIFNHVCMGAYGMAFDSAGNLYVVDEPTDNIYKFPPTGGVANAGTLITPTPLGSFWLTGLAFDQHGNLYASRGAVDGDFGNGDVVQVDPATGAIIREVATGLACPFALGVDPLSGDLFVGAGCTSFGVVGSTAIWRIYDPSGPAPTYRQYATLPSPGYFFGIAFAPDGTMYVNTGNFEVARISATDAPLPVTVTIVPGATWGNLGIATGGNFGGDAQFLILNSPASAPSTLGTFDLTTEPPSPGLAVAGALGAYDNKIIGPDGCLYDAAGPAVYRYTDANGNCLFQSTRLPAAISLTPGVVSPNPQVGDSQSFTATTHYGAPTGLPIIFTVTGANPQVRLVDTDANGQATFSYTAVNAESDTIVAIAKGSSPSNPGQVTWDAGKDVTFLTLNPSVKGGTPGNPVTVTASLTDVSQKPPTAVIDQPVTLGLSGDTCSVATDVKGIAQCTIAPPRTIPGQPILALTGSFAGTGGLTASNATAGFILMAPPEDAKLVVTPKTLRFGHAVELDGVSRPSRPRVVTVFNPKNRKQNMTVSFLGARNTGDFAIVSGPPTTCRATLAPKARCKIGLTFAPTVPGKRTGMLTIADTASINASQVVSLVGNGRQGNLRYRPRRLRFGKLAVDTVNGPKTIKIANPNPVPMAFAASITGDYAIASNDCPATLEAKGTCAIEVTFTPSAIGARPGALSFTDSAANSPQSVRLIGAGK